MNKKIKEIKEYKGENIAILACSNWKLYHKAIPANFKLWALNGLCTKIDNIDLLFDMHNWNDCSDDYPIPDYYYKLQEINNDYYIIKTDDDKKLKNVKLYPENEIIQQFGRNIKNSLPEMILYAWHIGGVKNIYLYGMSNSEFVKYPEMGFSLYQAIGFVRGKGINIFFVNDFEFDTDDDMYGYYKLTRKRIKE